MTRKRGRPGPEQTIVLLGRREVREGERDRERARERQRKRERERETERNREKKKRERERACVCVFCAPASSFSERDMRNVVWKFVSLSVLSILILSVRSE